MLFHSDQFTQGAKLKRKKIRQFLILKKREKASSVYTRLFFFSGLGATVPTLCAIYRSIHGLSLRDAPDILF